MATKFPKELLSPKALNYLLARARMADKHRRKLLRGLKKAGDGNSKLEVQKTYLGSQQVLFSALLRAGLQLEAKDRLKISEYEKLAANLKLYQPIQRKLNFS